MKYVIKKEGCMYYVYLGKVRQFHSMTRKNCVDWVEDNPLTVPENA